MILGGVCIFTGGVGLIANAIVSKRDRDSALAKTNLLLELFIRSIGIGLLERFTASNPRAEKLRTKLSQQRLSSKKAVTQAKQELAPTEFVIDLDKVDSKEWRTFLKANVQVILILLSNPAVSEGSRVTSVLRRIYNLELVLRAFTDGSTSDSAAGLSRELEGIYYHLTLLWLDYMVAMLKEVPLVSDQRGALNPFEPPNS